MGQCIIIGGGSGGIDPDELTVQPGEVLAGKLAGVQGQDEPVAGTMPNRGAVSQTLNAGGSYTIPEGYHNGNGKVTANSLSSQTAATASAAQILSGQSAWVNGGKLTGTMANQGAKTSALNCGGSYTIPAGYHNGSGKITANSLASQTSATATAAQILSGKTAWVNGSRLTGTIASMSGQTITPSASQQTISCSGKYMTGNITVAGVTVYKQLNVVVRSSTKMEAFKNWDGSNVGMYTVTYGALGFTPQMVIVVNNNAAGDSSVLASVNGGQIGINWWSASDEKYFSYAVSFSNNAGKCYYGSSGIKFPVGQYNTDYRIMAFGY